MPTKPLLGLPCVILAGGESRRFGSPKGLATLGSRRLVEWVLDRLSAQTNGPIAINTEAGNVYADCINHVVADRLTGSIGPLAGLHAAMLWAKDMEFSHVVTTSVDVPFLPADFIARLTRSPGSCVAASNNRIHPTCGVWETRLVHDLEMAIGEGLRAARNWVTLSNTRSVSFEATELMDPFFNINTFEDLLHAATWVDSHGTSHV